MKMFFNNKTIIGTLPAYLLLLIYYISMISPPNDRWDHQAAIMTLLASTEFIAVSFCYLFTITAFEYDSINKESFGELIFALIIITVMFLLFKQNPIDIPKSFKFDDFISKRFSIFMPSISLLSLAYTLTFYQRLCKKQQATTK